MKWHWDGFMIGLGIAFCAGTLGKIIGKAIGWWMGRRIP